MMMMVTTSATQPTTTTTTIEQQQQQLPIIDSSMTSSTTTNNHQYFSSPPAAVTTTTNNTSSSPLKQFLSKLFKRRKSQISLHGNHDGEVVGGSSVVVGAPPIITSHIGNNTGSATTNSNQAFKNLLYVHDENSQTNQLNTTNISTVTSHSTNNIINSSTSGRKSKRLSATFFKRRHTTQLSKSPILPIDPSQQYQEIENFREEAIKRQIQTNYSEFNSPLPGTISPSSSVTTITTLGSTNGLSIIPSISNGNTPHPNRSRRSSSSKSIPDNAETFFDDNAMFNLDDLMWITMEPTTTRTSLRPKTVSSNSLISVTSNNANSSTTGRRDSAAHSSVNDEEIVDDLEVIIPSITIDDGSVSRTLSSPTTVLSNNPPSSSTRRVNSSWDLDDDMEAHNSFSFSPGSINASNIINL